MTKSLAAEWGKYGIRLNAIAPGPFPTKGAWERLSPQSADRGESGGNIPMGRVGQMAELANLAVFLMADGCDYLTGQTIAIDGAMHLASGGNFAALSQTNVKRMLAYSSIAHAGYVLVAITARSEDGVAAAMFYLAAYVLMNIGAFAVVGHISGKGEKRLEIEDLSGLGVAQPMTAAALSIFLLSLIGAPLTGGFFGKFYIFKAALESKLVWLAALGLLNSAVAAYYYLRILVVMYMQEPGTAVSDLPPLPMGLKVALIAPAVGVLLLGIFPAILLEFAIRSAKL